mmetsp:Transcript_1327/g.1718  ORF Transcript_1327/g.1718 Transcript_1327/m.1718 type:complete len:345 (+) Transcript_1327:85-1119(+)
METEIGSLEHDLHSVFADNCVPSENTVYSPDLNVLEALDEYCAESTFHEIKKPLVLIGPPGCGKSAALANWLLSRKKAKENNKSRLSSLNPQEEFIFWHVVGCSRQSTNVGHMLNRLMTELRGHFEITREVSEGEDALSWDFPPFLELAVAKGKVLLVIDGVHRLRSEDGEAKLNWLPLRFPPNVRVVLSATDNFNSMFPKDALSITPTINQTSPNNNKNNKHVDAQTQANTLQNSGGGGGGSICGSVVSGDCGSSRGDSRERVSASDDASSLFDTWKSPDELQSLAVNSPGGSISSSIGGGGVGGLSGVHPSNSNLTHDMEAWECKDCCVPEEFGMGWLRFFS